MEDIKERAKQWALDREREAKAKEARFGRKPTEQKPVENTDPMKPTTISTNIKL